ncbi:MAG: hypothetical protein RLZZ597_2347 [Cyanobacteriota bacterium]|jgi:hypothetical protein
MHYRQSGNKGDKGTSTKALKQLADKDYQLHREGTTEVFSRAGLSTQLSEQRQYPIANIDSHPSGLFASPSKDGWSEPVGGCAPKRSGGMMPRLTPRHYQHFLDDGWTDSEIAQAVARGVRSVDQIEASRLLGYPAPSGGIWFPFSDTFGQLRPDQRWYIDCKTGQKKETGKYIHRKGGAGPSALWMPSGITKPKDLAAVTEGWKDAARPYLAQSIPIGAIPGVSWAAKVLPKGCGVDLVFDSDAWINAQVMSDLITGGLHTRGKVAIVPGEPTAKRGLTEFVNDGGEVAELLKSAKTPKALFLEWLGFLVATPLQPIKNADTVADLHRRVGTIAKRLWIAPCNGPL